MHNWSDRHKLFLNWYAELWNIKAIFKKPDNPGFVPCFIRYWDTECPAEGDIQQAHGAWHPRRQETVSYDSYAQYIRRGYWTAHRRNCTKGNVSLYVWNLQLFVQLYYALHMNYYFCIIVKSFTYTNLFQHYFPMPS